ncbi:MAG: 5-methyltetrahydropteroyltriglutamate--homocysteine methyltransferase [Solirubrobacteraceae bacterium]|nr:5-methyltetrahydropteroyltriglutamate--homocysteine methyltransferase [Solirubrobacteraceae bacterium]
MGDTRIKTTHVGSLIRTDEVIAIMRRLDKGEAVDPAERQAALETGVREVVRRQKEAGVDIVSDGEYGKSSWNYYVAKRLGGIEVRPPSGETFAEMPMVATDWARFEEFYAEYFPTEQDFENPGGDFAAVGEITYEGGPEIQRDIANLKAAMEAEGVQEGFLPTVAPASCFPTLIDEHYGSSEAALKAVAKAMGEEYKAVVDAGLNVQVDDAFIPFMYDVMVPPGTKQDWVAWAQPQIDAVNIALDGLPREKVRYHVCWGSWNGPHTNDVPLRDVLDLILQVNAGTILFENANPRHEHEWKVWQDVELPDGVTLAPGVISHATNVVEHPELVAERLERLARIVGPERVVASTDCGFAQGPYLRRVHPTIQWAKLESLSEGARIASRNLGLSPAAA